MHSPLTKPPGRPRRRTLAVWAGLAVGGVLPMIGCQAEYAGMTLPSGKFMHDDVQYFPPGPDFPWANTQAATQRARMQAQGIDVSGLPVPGQGIGPVTPPVAAGALPPGNANQAGGVPNINNQINPPGVGNPPGMGGAPPGVVPPPPPPGVVPPPGAPGAPGPTGGVDSLPR